MNLCWHHWIALGSGCVFGLAAVAADAPSFAEVYGLVRSNLVGMVEADLNRAAVEGLLEQLRPRVALVTDVDAPKPGTTPETGAAGTRLFDRSLAYFRLPRLETGVAGTFSAALAGLTNRSHLEGLVLDLRFAEGTDYAEAGRLADCFVAKPGPLLRWGEETFEATRKTNAFDHPVTVLVNGETKGAAEALAAVLRHAEVALLLGSTTAGQANLFKEFELSSGQRLRIASTPVRAGDGRELSPTGIRPDIAVAVRLEDERLYLDDPYRVLARPGPTARRGNTNTVAGATNRPTRMNEADLVRLRREGLNLDSDAPPTTRAATSEAPVVTDPVLARALDLLRGLAVLKSER